jgi:hypothetical protein
MIEANSGDNACYTHIGTPHDIPVTPWRALAWMFRRQPGTWVTIISGAMISLADSVDLL